MNVLITGGTGFVGWALAQRLLSQGHRVTVVSSSHAPLPNQPDGLTHLVADTTVSGDWQEVIPAQDVLVNLAGRTIFHLWTNQYKKKIKDSRVLTTHNLVAALDDKSSAVLLSASAAGYYGDGGDHEKDETAPSGNGFLAEVCREWEAETMKAERKGARVAIMRFGVILGAGGGAIAKMKTPFAMGMGGPLGNGRQWFPWIHLEDLVLAFLFLLEREECRGIYNFTAPEVVRQKEFATELASVLHRPAIMPAPSWAMKLAMGEFGKTLLQGQKTVPKALLSQGYSFVYPDLQPALEEILGG